MAAVMEDYYSNQTGASKANAWQRSSPSKWNQAVRKIKTDPVDRQLEDAPTVAALGSLLWKKGGHAPASVVGYLYVGDFGEVHRSNIRAWGSVSAFVGAHGDVFAMEPPAGGSTCPTIRLLTQLERLVARHKGRHTEEKAMCEKPALPCKFYRLGQCLRGAACKFSHDEPAKPQEEERAKTIRLQVEYYLSDKNLRTDAFFQNVIASSDGGWIGLDNILRCRRMQQMDVTSEEVIDALSSGLGRREGEPALIEVRRGLAGHAAVRRSRPPPRLEEKRTSGPSLAESIVPARPPPELLKDLSCGWQSVVEDTERTSFCYIRRNTWDPEVLQKEFELLLASTDWCKLTNRKEGHVTRSTAWYVSGRCCCRYVYGDVSVEAKTRPDWLEAIEARILGEGCGLDPKDWPNSVNMNLYENEEQNVGWHSDDEALFRGCERDCRIISASWGIPRNFEVALKDKNHASGRPSIFTESLRRVTLFPGDLCSMEGLFQKYYSHQLAKGVPGSGKLSSRVRINLTWRYIVNHKSYCPMCKG